MTQKITRLSKSRYLTGLQCPKALWLYRHRPDLKPPVSEQKQWLFDSGHEVGNLAQQYFGDGHLIDEEYYDTDKAIQSTQDAIAAGNDIIFEATAASPDGAFSKIDILQKTDSAGHWDLIEVKQSTEVKDYHLDDISLQRYAFSNAGYDVRKSILMHLNRQYVRCGDLDLNGLFLLEDCTELAQARMEHVPEYLTGLLKVVNEPQEPFVQIGRRCKSPFECDYIPYCWQYVPEYSVFDVIKGVKLDGLISMDILDIKDIPPGFHLTDRQLIDIQAFENQQVHVDHAMIQQFLDTLKYPLYYLDYETIFPAIPLFDYSSPYQQIPFQFSLHVQQQKGGGVDHLEFLYTGDSDPRAEFTEALIALYSSNGSVVVYNKAFESRINKELATHLPQHQTYLEDINSRMVDLLVPFKSRYLYHPKMNGAASIKKVLPAFVPELDYGALEISDGDAASRNYMKCLKGMVSGDEREKIYRDLRQYCEMDTLAEVRLIEKLYEYAG
jgi:hypothetical protein